MNIRSGIISHSDSDNDNFSISSLSSFEIRVAASACNVCLSFKALFCCLLSDLSSLFRFFDVESLLLPDFDFMKKYFVP